MAGQKCQRTSPTKMDNKYQRHPLLEQNGFSDIKMAFRGHRFVQNLLYISLLSCILHLSSCQIALESNVIESFIQSLDTKLVTDKNANAESRDSTTSEIPDQVATVGRLFQFVLPKEVVPENSSGFKLVEVGQDSLPEWLTYDPLLKSLLGLPAPTHTGNQHFIQITADENKLASTFAISVLEDSVHQAKPVDMPANEANEHVDSNEGTNKDDAIKCPQGSSVTKATIVLDSKIDQFDLKSMIKLMQDMGSHLGMPADFLRISAAAGRPLFDSSALVSGPGNIKDPQNEGVFMEWEVGCGNVQAYHMPILQRLETSSNDGSMSRAVGQNVLEWHVTNNRPSAPHRMKRRARNKLGRNRSRSMARGELVDYEDDASGFWNTPETEAPPTVVVTTRKPRPIRTRRPKKKKVPTATLR